jgi:Zn finger protein HypA/HybF involved in hydrogenase expression
MHEMSIALEICRIAEAQVGSEAAPSIKRIVVIVGDDSGIERSNLAFCLDALVTLPPFRDAKAELVAARGDVLRVDYLEVDDDRPSN